MKIIGNSNWGINPFQKCLLFRLCILSIALYGFQLWFYKYALMSYHLKVLGKMQRRAAIWILGAFKISPSYSIEAIVGLVPIYLHLCKLGGRSQLCTNKLPPSHIIQFLINSSPNSNSCFDAVSLNSLTNRQHEMVKGYLIDSANRFNKCFPSFDPLNWEFSPGFWVIDNFSDRISFVLNKEKNNKLCAQTLDKIVLESSSSPFIAIIASDTSIKNSVTTSIAHIHTHDKPTIKTIHHVVNITSTEAELFTIRCGINQVSCLNYISKIIIITDSIHAAKRILDPSIHSYQVQAAAILKNLRYFFNRHKDNSIKFWKCPSHLKWWLHNEVDKETKKFNLVPLFPCKNSWEFSKKCESDNILNFWKITFQASNLKGSQFLDLVNNDNNPIEPTYAKGGSWLKSFGHSNSLCARAIRAITSHALIGKYRLRFFPREEFKCSYGFYPIESRHHILHECNRFNRYWNLRRDSLSHFVMFLVFNPSTFSFSNSLA